MTDKIQELFKNKLIDISKKKLVIFGTGNTSLLYENSFVREGLDIYAFCDNNSHEKGETFFDKKIISFKELLELKDSYVLICSQNIDISLEIKNQLDENNILNDYMDYYIFLKHKADVLKVVDILYDDESKKVYLDMIYNRMTNQPVDEKLFNNNTYFCYDDFYTGSAKQTFVDLGAYVGDTLEQYLFTHSGLFDKIYAFEPEARCYNAIKNRVERLNKEWVIGDHQIELINNPVGKTSCSVSQKKADSNLKVGAIMDKCNDVDDVKEYMNMICLDEYFKNIKTTFIKADIESYEYDMLLGAKEIIDRDKPIMAICIYHNASDMFDIPLLIYKYNKKYKFRIKHHSYKYCETVLYVS